MMPAQPSDTSAPRPTRRTLLRRLALGGGGLIAGGGLYAWQIEPHWVEVTRVTLPIHGLGPEFNGYRIAHISDLHTCDRVSTRYLQRCMDRINELNADLIVVTGDLITGGLGDEIPTAAGVLSRLRCKDGVIVCLGNHDYYRWVPGQTRFDVADRVAAAMKHIGARVLRNQSEVISRGRSRLTIVGLDDLLVGRCDAKAAFAGVSTDAPVIMLSHNPDSMGILRHWPGDVVLSGHTHGGQVCIPLVGPLHLPVNNREYASGRVRVDGKTLYVNRGLGHLAEVRFNCRPEITVHMLR